MRICRPAKPAGPVNATWYELCEMAAPVVMLGMALVSAFVGSTYVVSLTTEVNGRGNQPKASAQPGSYELILSACTVKHSHRHKRKEGTYADTDCSRATIDPPNEFT